MKALIITMVIALAIFTGCSKEESVTGTVDTLYIADEVVEYNNTVSLVFSQKGEYTIYDCASGAEVYQVYKHNGVWLGEGYDTVTMTVPDTIITYHYDVKSDDMRYNINVMENGLFDYSTNDGWRLHKEDDRDDIWWE